MSDGVRDCAVRGVFVRVGGSQGRWEEYGGRGKEVGTGTGRVYGGEGVLGGEGGRKGGDML